MAEDPKLSKLAEVLKLVTESITRQEFVDAFKAVAKMVSDAVVALEARIDARLAQVRNGRDGKDGKDGKSITGPRGPQGPRGPEGKQGRSFVALRGEPGRDGSPDTGPQIVQKLEELDGDNRLSKDAVRGIELLEAQISAIELRPVGRGGAKGIGLYVGGARKIMTAQAINLIAGNNVSITYAQANGRNDITISATGGSGSFSVLAATGTVDDSNTSFTFASEPALVVVNGQSYRDGHGCTIAGTSVTLDFPVGTGGDIYGLG